MGWHDDFVEWGAHSIAIARLTQNLQEKGYAVSVRGLLSDTRTAAAIAELTQTESDDTDLPNIRGAEPPAIEPASVQGWAMSFKTFSAAQAVAAVVLRVPLLFMAALGLAIIDPEELLLAGDVAGFLQATVVGYCVYMVVPFANLGWVRLLRLIQIAISGTATLAPGRYRKFCQTSSSGGWSSKPTSS